MPRARKAALAVKPPAKRDVTGAVVISNTRRARGTAGTPQVLYNPDVLVGRKGLRIYDDMLVDEQVKACVALKKAAVVGPGWTLEPAGETASDQVLCDLLKSDLDAWNTSVDDALWQGLKAISHGFALAEQVWAVDAARLRLMDLRDIVVDDLEFEEDGYGLWTAVVQQGNRQSPFVPGKFFHFANDPQGGNPYGQSDLRAAHRDWWHKTNWVQWLAIYGEKLADAPLVSKHPKGTPDNKVAVAQQVLENLQARTVLNVPEGWDVSTLTDPRDPKRTFLEAIDHHNAGIAKALLVPDKLGVAGGEVQGGSYALGQTQFDVFLFVLSILQRRLQRAFQRQVIDRMVQYAQPGAAAPVFKLLPMSEDDRAALATLWTSAVQNDVQIQTIKDANHWRRLVKFPTITQAEWDAEQQRKLERARAVAEVTAPSKPSGGDDGEGGPGRAPSPATEQDDKAEMARVALPTAFWRPLTAVEQRADMAQKRDALEDGTTQLGDVLARGALAMVGDVKAAAAKMLADLTPTAVRDLAVKTSTFAQLRQGVQAALTAAYNRALREAGEEVVRGKRGAQERVTAKVAASQAVARTWDDVLESEARFRARCAVEDGRTFDAFVESVRYERARLHLASRPGLIGSAAEKFFRAKSFWSVGILEQDILKAAQAVLFNAVKGDKPARTVLLELDEALAPWVPEVDAAGRAVNVPARLETIARTNIAEAQSEARFGLFTDPDLESVVEALTYSAILDDRVRATHAAMDGVTKPAAWWLGPPDRRPPAGFQCRCQLIPVVAGDDVEITPDADIPGDFPDPGFK